MNALIEHLLMRELGTDDPCWLEKFFDKADKIGLQRIDGQPLTQAEIYDC